MDAIYDHPLFIAAEIAAIIIIASWGHFVALAN